MRRLKIIVITAPEAVGDEAEAIAHMLGSGNVDRVHIRKPGYTPDRTRALLDNIPPQLLPRLSLHDHHVLAEEYGTGVHLNSRNPLPPDGFDGILSRSCHSLDQIGAPADYLFVSPVFDSISKHGYKASFSHDELRARVDRRCIALGGVEPHLLRTVADIGFGGAALLGYIWRNFSLTTLDERLKELCSSL